MKNNLSKAVSYFTYPLFLATTLGTIHAAVSRGWDLKHTLWGYLFGLLFTLILLERLFPLKREWGMTGSSFLRDLKYLLSAGPAIGIVRSAFGVLAIVFSEHHRGLLSDMPLIPSVAIFFLVFEFIQYWYHRYSHEGTGPLGRFLWKTHLAHHLPDKVYIVMHGVFHPLNAFITAILIQAVLLLLGLSPQAVFAVTLLIDLQTMISHCNVDIRAGIFNYVFVGTELHRYHHGANADEAKNYGTVLTLWDMVFGTFVYRPGKIPSALGVEKAGLY